LAYAKRIISYGKWSRRWLAPKQTSPLTPENYELKIVYGTPNNIEGRGRLKKGWMWR